MANRVVVEVVSVSKWIGDGTEENPYRLKVKDDYPNASYSDLGQSVNTILSGVDAKSKLVLSDADLQAIKNDVRYEILETTVSLTPPSLPEGA